MKIIHVGDPDKIARVHIPEEYLTKQLTCSNCNCVYEVAEAEFVYSEHATFVFKSVTCPWCGKLQSFYVRRG